MQSGNFESKAALRKQFREILRQISAEHRIHAAHTAAHIFLQQKIFIQSEHIACYFSFKDEFDSAPLMEGIWQAQKQCYLPVLTPENSLRFMHYNKGDALQKNRYSIYEPVNKANELQPDDLDIVIMPLISFDLKGSRLGAGGGYYDRTFAFLKKKPVKRPLLIGLAYAQQQAEELPLNEWDVCLDGVITETEFRLLTALKHY